MYFFKFQIFGFFENGQIKKCIFFQITHLRRARKCYYEENTKQCFGSLQTQTLDSNKKHLRSKHYSPRRAWVPTLWEPKYGKLQIPKLQSTQPSIVQFNLIHRVPN